MYLPGHDLSSKLVHIIIRMFPAAEGRLHAMDEVMESHFGVSIEEEMMMLSRYQRAFQSSSKVLSVVDELLNTVINLK